MYAMKIKKVKVTQEKEHQMFCNGKPTMLNNEYNQETGKLKLTCVNCGKVVYEADFEVIKSIL